MTDQQKTERPRFFRKSDLAFVLFLLGMIGLVIMLGHRDHDESERIQGVRATATKFAAWLEAGQELRDGGKPMEPLACSRSQPWPRWESAHTALPICRSPSACPGH